MLVLKIILLTIAALLCLVLIALFLPVTVFFSYKNQANIRVYYCGFKVFSTSKKGEDEKEQKAEQKRDTPKKESYFKRVYKRLGLTGTVRYFAGLARLILEKLKGLIKHIKIRRFCMNLAVASDDAAQTALRYGEVCAVVYPVLSFLFSLTDCKAKSVNVSADFNSVRPRFEISFSVRALPIFLLITAITALWEYKKYEGVNFHE